MTAYRYLQFLQKRDAYQTQLLQARHPDTAIPIPPDIAAVLKDGESVFDISADEMFLRIREMKGGDDEKEESDKEEETSDKVESM